jgi:hypothetical protein
MEFPGTLDGEHLVTQIIDFYETRDYGHRPI